MERGCGIFPVAVVSPPDCMKLCYLIHLGQPCLCRWTATTLDIISGDSPPHHLPPQNLYLEMAEVGSEPWCVPLLPLVPFRGPPIFLTLGDLLLFLDDLDDDRKDE